MDGIPSGFKEKLGKFEEERKNPDVVFGYGVKVLISIKGEPLTNFERNIFRQCVEEAYEVVPEEKHTLDSLERAAEDIFYTRYFGITGYREIPGFTGEDVGRDGWEKCMGKYWRSRKEDEFAIPPIHDPYDDHDLYFLSAEERSAVIRNIKPKSISKEEKEKELFEQLKNLDVFEIIEHMIDRVDLFTSDPVVKGTVDVHDVRINKHSLLQLRDSLKEEEWTGDLGKLKENDPTYFIFLIDIIVEIGY